MQFHNESLKKKIWEVNYGSVGKELVEVQVAEAKILF